MNVSQRTSQRRKKSIVLSELKFIRDSSSERVNCNDGVIGTETSINPNPLVVSEIPGFRSTIYFPESDSDNTSNGEVLVSGKNIHDFLSSWAIQHNISHTALKDVLGHLKTYDDFKHLPKDPRTLLKTPKGSTKSLISGGECMYFNLKNKILSKIKSGLVDSVIPIVKKIQNNLNCSLITIAISIDGIPLTKSTNKQFWPVLVSVDQSTDKKPFVASLFYGNTKLKNTDFLKPFIDSCKKLELEGIVIDCKPFQFRVSRIMADAPARSFIKGIRNHNSYEGCERCNQVGEWRGRVVYPYTEFEKLRSDDDFLVLENAEIVSRHICQRSIFSELQIGLVTQVPLDYLHLVCLGVVRKLVRTWVKGKLPYRLKTFDVQQISFNLLKCKKYFPRAFQRRPRPLDEINHFKGSEFRSILLYTGVAVFYKILDSEKYEHFLLLHTSFYILLSTRASESVWNNLAKCLLQKFVRLAEKLYGAEFISYNVHGLLHISDDAILFGSLDNASTFMFENFMQVIKKILRSNNLFLEQAYNRISEMEYVSGNLGTISNNREYSKVFELSVKIGDNCFMLSSGEIVLAKELYSDPSGKGISIFSKFLNLKPLKEYPIDSREVGIYRAENISNSINRVVYFRDILLKYVCLPVKNFFICIPLLGSCDYYQ